MQLIVLAVFYFLFYTNVFAQSNQVQTQQKPKMTYLGQFDAGSPNAGIYKVFDPTDQVLCYILMPDAANRRVVNNQVLYEGNSLGSISCVKIAINSPQEKLGNDKKATIKSK